MPRFHFCRATLQTAASVATNRDAPNMHPFTCAHSFVLDATATLSRFNVALATVGEPAGSVPMNADIEVGLD